MSSGDLEASLRARNARRERALQRRQESEAVEQSFQGTLSAHKTATESVRESMSDIAKQLTSLDERSKQTFGSVLSAISQISAGPVPLRHVAIPETSRQRAPSITLSPEDCTRARDEERLEQQRQQREKEEKEEKERETQEEQTRQAEERERERERHAEERKRKEVEEAEEAERKQKAAAEAAEAAEAEKKRRE